MIPIVECRAPYKMFLDTVAYRQEIINLIDDEVNNFKPLPRRQVRFNGSW